MSVPGRRSLASWPTASAREQKEEQGASPDCVTKGEQSRMWEETDHWPTRIMSEPATFVAARGVRPRHGVQVLQDERVAGPGLFQGLASIPIAERVVRELGDQRDNVEPGQLGSGLLTNSAIRALLGKKPHVFEVGGRL